MSLRQRAIRGAIWSAIEKWGAQLVSTAIFLLLARLLGAEAFGLVALANLFIYFMQIFADQGFAQAIVQKDELEPEHLDTAFWTSVLMGVMFIVAVFAGAEFVANFYDEPDLAPIIRWMSISFLFSGLSSVQMAILQRNMQFKIFAIRSLVATTACGIAGIGAALMGFGVWSLVIKEIVFGLAGAVLLWGTSSWRPGFRFSPQHFKELFSFGINIVGFNFLGFFNKRSDDLLIGYFLGPVALGYYSVAYRFLLIMNKLLSTVTGQVALPTFSRMQKEPERIRNAFYKITEYTSLIAFPTFLGMAVLAPEIVQALFGAEWLPSVPVMQILAIVGALNSIYYFNGVVLLAVGKPSLQLGLQSLNTACNIIGFLIAVQWGIVAVATSFAIRAYLLSPLPLLMIKKIIKIDFWKYLSQLKAATISSIGMVLSIMIVEHFIKGMTTHVYWLLGIYISTGILSYVLFIVLVSPKLIAEIKSIVASP